ncbi:hypothetical protein JQ581_29905 [Bradyrhizobium liaoningense]|uniref:hypothetical protein n=1 Tax=Bradyrhizobium liaoningense TaxID=43992 RepID=UPI001BA4EFFF|nr:hypothetical protein [Bradyrhizobium liaoningense]MBR0741154.1 hypothetical protein [Bradyrhizobium liaoningense]
MSDAIRLKVLPKFPAKLIGGAGIDVTIANGHYTFDLDYADFPVIGAVPAGTTYALIFNPATGQYAQLPISLLGGGGGGGIPEAPINGVLYGRKDAGWTPLGSYISDAPADGQLYGRKNNAWVAATGAAVYVQDTPPVGAPDNSLWFESDTGTTYLRYNDGNSMQWVAQTFGAPSPTPDLPAGVSLRTVQTVDPVNRTATTTSYTATGTISPSISPASASNKLRVQCTGIVGGSVPIGAFLTLFRSINGAAYTDLTPAGSGELQGFVVTANTDTRSFAIDLLDAPATTLPVLYQLYMKNNTTGTVYTGRRGVDTLFNTPTFLTVTEIKG